jgi:hypothetical protein
MKPNINNIDSLQETSSQDYSSVALFGKPLYGCNLNLYFKAYSLVIMMSIVFMIYVVLLFIVQRNKDHTGIQSRSPKLILIGGIGKHNRTNKSVL